MRIEKNTVPFTAASIATTGVPVTLVDFDFQDAEMISILVEITSHAGTATNTFFDLVPRVGSIVTPGVAANGDVIGTADLTNLTGLFLLSLPIMSGEFEYLVRGPGTPLQAMFIFLGGLDNF